MRHPFPALASAGLALLLSAPVLATEGTSIPEAPLEAAPVVQAGPASFEGSDWRLAAYRSGSGLAEVASHSRPTRFRFEAGEMSGNTGCNQIRGGYQLDGATLAFAGGLAATRMGCPEPLMTQEKAILQAIKSVASYRHEGDRLEFLDAGEEPVLRFEAIKPTALEGRVWKLERYNNGRAALVSPVAGSEISLSFDARGRIGGSDGCNRYMSGFTRDGETLTLGPLASTRMACPAKDGRGEQASAYAAALGRVTAFRIEGDRLTLLDADGHAAASFQAEAEVETSAAKP